MSTTHRPAARELPRHFVSARHGTLHRDSATGDSSWRPFGLHHARRVGAPVTECGLPAAEWPMFWELAFPGVPTETCEDCLVAVQFADRDRHLFADLAGGAR